jgi:asparagine synthase (glutamine-hydrolysing)
MCAIVGIVSSVVLTDAQRSSCQSETMVHRGPDDAGEWASGDGRVLFGHRRLAILDLTSAGHQPMHDASGVLTIVFNGEIYNFAEIRENLQQLGVIFRSNTDTEVILEAYREWGPECLSRLNGMFAFAIYDACRRAVFLARDRAGEKPLFYHSSGQQLRFASELKALLADKSLPRRIQPEAMACYLTLGYVPGDRCILQGFNKLPPAHAMTFDLETGATRVWRYWQEPELSRSDEPVVPDDQSLVQELECLLEDSVRRQLVADVPVGILLSGGVDSSLVTAMAVRTSQKIKTFSISFPGHGKMDETEHARLIARHFETEHTELAAQPATVDLLPLLARQFDEPMVDSSMIPTFLVSRLVRQHCTVALGGDGADELFGGYAHYSRMLWMQSRLGLIPLPLREALSVAAGLLLPTGFKGRNWLKAMGCDFNRSLPGINAQFDAVAINRLMKNHGAYPEISERGMSSLVPACPDLLQRATHADFQNYLAEDILVKVDRASMLNSLEIRAPFLDSRMIEFAFGKVPSRLKATTRDKKILLKLLAKQVLPAGFDIQRKQGFSIPMMTWLKAGEFRDFFHDVLAGPQCTFNRREVDALFQGQDSGRCNGERLFALVLFELWRREYNVSL